MAQGGGNKQSQDRKEEETEPIDEQQLGAEFAKAFQELARGEQAAAGLEGRLDDIEARIEQLLARAEENARQASELKFDRDGTDQTEQKTKES